jgi:hypothetical protein
MLQNIAHIASLPYRTNDSVIMEMLRRISRKLPAGLKVDDPTFFDEVIAASKAVDSEGSMAILSLVRQVSAPEPEKVLKIKSSPKGARIDIAAADGVRYSFGPIWNVSVTKGKGIAYAECNRNKLNHQGLMLGVTNAADLDVAVLGKAIADLLETQG